MLHYIINGKTVAQLKIDRIFSPQKKPERVYRNYFMMSIAKITKFLGICLIWNFQLQHFHLYEVHFETIQLDSLFLIKIFL